MSLSSSPPLGAYASNATMEDTPAYAATESDSQPFLGYDEKTSELPNFRHGGGYRHLKLGSIDGDRTIKAPSRRSTRAMKSVITRHPILISLVAGLALVALSIGLGWVSRLKPFDITDKTMHENEDNTSGDAVWLTATLVGIDSLGQTMTIDWQVSFADCGGDTYTDFNIFLDQNLLAPSSNPPTTLSNNVPPPFFFLNCTTFSNGSNTEIFQANSAIFRTQLTLTTYGTGRSQQSYPFDMYLANLWIWAETSPGNLSADVFLWDTTGLAPGFDARVIDAANAPGADVKYKQIEVTRGTVVIVYALTIAVAIWLVTLVFIAIGVAVIILRKKMSSSVLVLPVSTLFAFTQLRSTMPGAPNGFGAIVDFMCILPCMVIVTFCSVVMLAIFLWRDPEKHDDDLDSSQEKTA